MRRSPPSAAAASPISGSGGAVPANAELFGAALERLAGPALLLDEQLRIRAATAAAEALLRVEPRPGTPAGELLEGLSAARLAAIGSGEGHLFELAGVAAPRRRRALVVRPLRLDGPPPGWLLLLDEPTANDGDGPVEFHGMWTRDPAMKRVFRLIERVAADDVTVLVRGETGAGKELVANAIHALSPRRKGPFRALNCAALPGNLLESELFGHTRGAFTGAVGDAPGHVLLAHGGTLFLDEVAELPLELQAKLLRVIETRSVLPVGARHPVPVDVRIVSATHRALRKEVEAGRFRADLMFRLRVIPLFLPALRERRGDVPLLCERIILEMNRAGRRRRVEKVAPEALRVLERYDWPGNVRELRNVMAYAYTIGDGPLLVADDLPPELFERRAAERQAPPAGPPEPAPAPPALPTAPLDGEAKRIAQALARSAGHRGRAARLLGMSRITLWRRMRDLGLTAGNTPAETD